MSLSLPDDIPIAVESPSLLKSHGLIFDIKGLDGSAAFAFRGFADGLSTVWCLATYRNYRGAWEKAAQQGLVDKLSVWGEWIDVDHLLARCVAE